MICIDADCQQQKVYRYAGNFYRLCIPHSATFSPFKVEITLAKATKPGNGYGRWKFALCFPKKKRLLKMPYKKNILKAGFFPFLVFETLNDLICIGLICFMRISVFRNILDLFKFLINFYHLCHFFQILYHIISFYSKKSTKYGKYICLQGWSKKKIKIPIF